MNNKYPENYIGYNFFPLEELSYKYFKDLCVFNVSNFFLYCNNECIHQGTLQTHLA